jgi:hypothetical protein
MPRQCPTTEAHRSITQIRHAFAALWLLAAAWLAITMGWSPAAHALSFAPTDAEWATWPDYCRARYTVSGAGVDSKFAGTSARGEVDKWKGIMGPDGWYALHHYCAAIVLINRAKRAPSKIESQRTYGHTFDEAQFALNRTNPENPLFPKISSLMARAAHALGKDDVAERVIGDAQRYHPKSAELFAAAAVIKYDARKLEAARDILLSGNEATEHKSAELNYLLGLVQFDLKDYTAAREAAKNAYALGYPLPGLKRKLAAAGQWAD